MGQSRKLAIIATVSLSSVACQSTESPLATAGPAETIRPSFVVAGEADLEEFELCKYGSTATFEYTVTSRNTGAVSSSTVTLDDGDCRAIAVAGGLGADVTVSENTGLLPSGFQFVRADVTVITQADPQATPTTQIRTEPTPTVTDFISGYGGGTIPARGVLAEYYNRATGEGEGCTPGYWKQPHHFDSWPAPYQPTDLFSAYFEDAFPGQTLLQVLSQGGGKLIALGRHTVAALLNAASSGVNYPLTVAGVITEFNNTYPASNYGPQKDRFEGFNQQGCPLN